MDISKKEIQKDRFGFTMFLSINLHAIILIAIGLEFPLTKINESVAISLAQRKPNQQFLFSDVAQSPTIEDFKIQVENLPPTRVAKSTLELMIQDLQVRIESRRENNRKRPQRHTISTISAKKQQAIYLETWRKRIEEVGNQYYPEQARKNKIFGDLRILVAVRADGQVEDIRILETSGFKVLDDAAEKIVILAAPFDPFPEEISSETDILEIIRTWRFHKGTSLETL